MWSEVVTLRTVSDLAATATIVLISCPIVQMVDPARRGLGTLGRIRRALGREDPMHKPLRQGRAPKPRDGCAPSRGDTRATRPEAGSPTTTVHGLTALQRSAGNRVVTALLASHVAPRGTVQREIEDGGQVGQDDLYEAGADGGPKVVSEEAETGGLNVAKVSEFGDMDGEVDSGVHTHAFSSKGKTSTAKWHHAAGPNGGTGYSPGSPTLVAPNYKSAAAAKAGGQATAWIEAGTGTAKVKTWFIGVPSGDNGTANWAGSGGGLVYLTSSAVSRMDTHERGHSTESKTVHDATIKPMETRISTYRGVNHKTMKGADTAAAIAALQTHIDWNTTITKFNTDDVAANTPMGTWDTTDQAKANFYHDKGAKKVKGTDYGHYIEAP